jgi:hypothetical protein
MATSENLLATLRQIAAAETSRQWASIDIADAEQLCELGLAQTRDLGQHAMTREYRITREGKAVLRKADEDG